VHQAAASFPRVALYFENSLLAPDLNLLSSAAAAVTRVEKIGSKIVVASELGAGVPWRGAAAVDGAPWPVADGETVWLPGGVHSLEPADGREAGPLLLHLNGELKSARAVDATTMEFSYQSNARAIAILDREPRELQVDGTSEPLQPAGPMTIFLPRGQHFVTVVTGGTKENLGGNQ
jgi:hypothetical protein